MKHKSMNPRAWVKFSIAMAATGAGVAVFDVGIAGFFGCLAVAGGIVSVIAEHDRKWWENHEAEMAAWETERAQLDADFKQALDDQFERATGKRPFSTEKHTVI